MDEVSSAPRHESGIWVEVLSRHHPRDVVQRHRFATLPITLGRAYDNDVVVDDPHAAAHHVRIARAEDGTLVAEDLGSRNGLLFEHGRARHERVALDGERALRFGHMLVRVRPTDYPVPAEVELIHRLPSWPAAILCLAIVFALALLELWLGETSDPRAIRYLTPMLILTAAVAVWVSGWAIVTRVFTGHARFGLHFLIVAAGLLAFQLYDQIAEAGAFALSWTPLTTTAYLVAWLIFGAVCFAHLVVLSPSRRPLKLGVAALLAAAGIAMQTLKLGEYRSNYGQPVTLKRLEPPALRLVAPQREPAFFADSAALREKLDQARSEEPVGGDAYDASDD